MNDADLRNADLSGADLSDAGLRHADLRNADLSGADLSGVSLRNADLRNADLSGADLSYSDLSGASLNDADLRGAHLDGVNLSNANLSGADLDGAFVNPTTSFFHLQCPEEGSFVAWKKAGDYIVKLLIPEDAKRSSATTRKCRTNKAKVLAIETIDGATSDVLEIGSNYNKNFIYRIGETVSVSNFCDDRWKECAPGIHFFTTRQEAVNYPT